MDRKPAKGSGEMMGRDSENVRQAMTADESRFPSPSTGPLSDESNDSELVASIRQGDDSAFEMLFERHKVRISSIAGRFFQDHVEDIVQECFTRAYFALSSFSDEGEGSVGAWLSKIAFNTCYDEMRRRDRRRESFLSELPEAEAQTIQGLTTDSSAESLVVSRDLANKLLAQLSPEDRLVLVLLDVEGLSVSEISQTMGWSVSKVKVRVFRARADMRRVLKKFL